MTRIEQLAAVMSDIVAEMVQQGATQEYVRAAADLAWFTGQPADARTEQTPTIISSLDAAYHQVQLAIGPLDENFAVSAVVSAAQFADIREYLYRFHWGPQSTYRGIVLRPVHDAKCSVLIVQRRFFGEDEPRIVATIPQLQDPAVLLPRKL